MLQRLQGHCPRVSFAWHWRVIDKIIIIIKCLPGECVSLCPIKTRYWELAPGPILQMAFVPLGCVLTRGGNCWRESEEPGESPSQGRAPFEAGSLRHHPRCTFCHSGLLSSWFKSRGKENVTFKHTYEESASSLRKRRGRENSFLLQPPDRSGYSGWIVWRERKQFRRKKKEKGQDKHFAFSVLARNSFILMQTNYTWIALFEIMGAVSSLATIFNLVWHSVYTHSREPYHWPESPEFARTCVFPRRLLL